MPSQRVLSTAGSFYKMRQASTEYKGSRLFMRTAYKPVKPILLSAKDSARTRLKPRLPMTADDKTLLVGHGKTGLGNAHIGEWMTEAPGKVDNAKRKRTKRIIVVY